MNMHQTAGSQTILTPEQSTLLEELKQQLATHGLTVVVMRKPFGDLQARVCDVFTLTNFKDAGLTKADHTKFVNMFRCRHFDENSSVGARLNLTIGGAWETAVMRQFMEIYRDIPSGSILLGYQFREKFHERLRQFLIHMGYLPEEVF